MTTRFPPEPNGYLHIGHAKSICLNFGLAPRVRRRLQPAFRRHQPDQGRAGVRRRRSMDSVRWLGFDWGRTASTSPRTISSRCTAGPSSSSARATPTWTSYTPDEMREHARHADPGGHRRAHRDRPTAENLDLFRRMRAGEFPDGSVCCAPRSNGLAQHQHARPGDLPHPARLAPPDRRRVVHLPDVRLRASPRGRAWSTSPTRCARWSSRTIGRSTTG